MEDKDWNFERVDNSRPPLRWIANMLGSWGTYHILRAFKAMDNGNYRLSDWHGFMGSALLKPYTKWGTSYVMKTEIEEDI